MKKLIENNNNKFNMLMKKLKYSKREKFKGIYLKNNIINEFINMSNSKKINLSKEKEKEKKDYNMLNINLIFKILKKYLMEKAFYNSLTFEFNIK